MIVVGVDGSQSGLEAVTWAVREAARRGTAVRIVHVMAAWAAELPEEGRFAEVGRWMRENAQAVLAAAADRARADGPGVAVERRLIPGEPLPALLDAAAEAELLVVGNHGLGGFRGLLLGSVALGLAGRTACPLVVVRGTAEPRREVVVGVDGSPAGAAAIDFAFAEAARRGATLRAVHARRSLLPRGVLGPAPALPRDGAERRLLAEALAGRRERHPDVKVVEQIADGHPVDLLRQAAQDADLLVVGSRGLGGIRGLVLGSVSHALLHHAECPVAVVPSAR